MSDKEITPFISTHNLPFEVADWPHDPALKKFKVGTCEGICGSRDGCYDIIEIKNHSPGNGHLEDVFEWFENNCKSEGKDLIIHHVMNKRFESYLKTKRGFTGQSTLRKTF